MLLGFLSYGLWRRQRQARKAAKLREALAYMLQNAESQLSDMPEVLAEVKADLQAGYDKIIGETDPATPGGAPRELDSL